MTGYQTDALLINGRRCPICGAANECRIANGCLYKGPCWCEAASIPPAMVRHLAELQLEAACVCQGCLAAIALNTATFDSPEVVLKQVRAEASCAQPTEGEDSYLDEQGRIVFTAAYHSKRGYCCGHGCRHCPYPRPNQ